MRRWIRLPSGVCPRTFGMIVGGGLMALGIVRRPRIPPTYEGEALRLPPLCPGPMTPGTPQTVCFWMSVFTHSARTRQLRSYLRSVARGTPRSTDRGPVP
jgi:hypothetical protein